LTFADGVFYISLATVSAPEFVHPAIASALGFQPHDPGPEPNRFLNYLRARRMLVVLDNVEHLLAGAEVFLDLLQWAPGVKILAISRERMNLQGEWIFEIQGLPVPLNSQVEGLENYSSVALFLQSARRARPDFTLEAGSDQERKDLADSVVRICRAVEGMPLAVELAAAWVRVMSTREIAHEIERNLDFLTTTARNIPERHRSLRAAFDHSWKMLTESEQAAMRQLSVFQGGFRREAAERVAGAPAGVLLSLVDKSMLVRSGDGRYWIHELIRLYTGTSLARDIQEQAQAQDRHMEYYLQWLAAHEPALKGARQKQVLEELSAENDNLRLAWKRASLRRQAVGLKKAALPWMLFYELRNAFREGEALFQQAVEALETQASPAAGRMDEPGVQAQGSALGTLLANQAWFSYRSGRTEQALALFRVALARLREGEDQGALADALWQHTSACWFAGEYQEASRSLEEGLAIYRELGQTWGVANLTVYQGVIAYEKGAGEEAYRMLREGLALSRLTEDPRLVSFAAISLSRTPEAVRRYAETNALLQEVLQWAVETGDRYSQGVALVRLALLAHANQASLKACALVEESFQLFREIGDLWSLSGALNYAARFHLDRGEAAAAQAFYLEAFKTAEEARVLPNALTALAGLACTRAETGEPGRALELAWQILHHPASPAEALESAGKLRQELETRLPLNEAADRLEQARTKTFDQVAREILASQENR
jgi:predicted ATPase